jgi:DNA-binding response OmpR family regulator
VAVLSGQPALASMSIMRPGSTEPVACDSAEAARPRRLLIVHGEAATRDALVRGLVYENHGIVEAASGRAALDCVAAEPFDLILLDMAPPDVDGLQLLTLLTADSRLCHIPVIMIATLDESDDVARWLEAGAADYLSKPYYPFLLRARVDAALEKKRLRDTETALREAMAAARLSHEKLVQETGARTKLEITQLQETVKALRQQLDSTTSTAKASIDAARSSAAAELRQLRATCKRLREQFDAAISGQGPGGAFQASSDRPASERRRLSDRRARRTNDGR